MGREEDEAAALHALVNQINTEQAASGDTTQVIIPDEEQ